MAVTVTYYLQSFAWDGGTYDNTSGGSLEATVEHGGDPLDDRTGIDEYPPFLAVVNKMCRVTIRARQVKLLATANPGASEGNLVLTLKTKAGTVTITLANMQLIHYRGQQGRAVAGDAEFAFMHRSSDGAAVPVS